MYVKRLSEEEGVTLKARKNIQDWILNPISYLRNPMIFTKIIDC